MAVQIPDPGTGNGQTGDNEYVFRKKVKDNFSDQTNAASRLVGPSAGQIPLAEDILKVAMGNELIITPPAGSIDVAANTVDISKVKRGFYYFGSGVSQKRISIPANFADNAAMLIYAFPSANTSSSMQLAFRLVGGATSEMYLRTINNDSVDAWAKLYTTANTTKEPTTGYLKAASPILHLFNDNLEKEHEAIEQDITVEKLGVGDYLIKGSTGLSSEGWSLSPPKDIHGNVLCMVEATEADGNINVKTYKRKFDFDIVAIVPDYDQPFDIPLGHSVDLRLNDLTMEV